MTAVKKPAAPKKPAAKAPAKKPAPKAAAKPVATPVEAPKPKAAKVEAKEARLLYTFRLEPSLIDKLNVRGKKENTTHAEIARRAIAAYVG